MPTLYKKVLRELGHYKSRTLLTLIGIAIGIFSIGFILSAYAILNREMDKNFMSTEPASIILQVSNLDKEALELIKSKYPSLKLEPRKCVAARIDRGNGTYGTIYLYGIYDIDAPQIDSFKLEEGKLPNRGDQDLQLAIERDSLSLLPQLKDDYAKQVNIKLPEGDTKQVEITGKVHAPGLSPASMEKYSYGFMPLEDLKALGDEGWFDEVLIIDEALRFDREALKQEGMALKGLLEVEGYSVEGLKVPKPGEHPHHDQLKSFIFLLEAFTVMALVIASLIVLNLFSAIMNTQKKQLAMMKAMGAVTLQIARPYFFYVLLISVVAELIALPLAYLSGCRYALFAATTLNFNITSYEVSLWVIGIQIVVGLMLPLLVAFYPIYKNAQVTVKEGLAEQNLVNTKLKPNKKKKGIAWPLWLKLPFTNLLRKKGRTIMAVIALAAGGIIFLVAQNMKASISATARENMNTFKQQYDIKLAGRYEEEQIEKALADFEEISGIQIYSSSKVSLLSEEKQTASYMLKAFPEDTKIMEQIRKAKEDHIEHPILVNEGVLEEEPELYVGETLIMKIGDKEESVTIVGIVRDIPPLPYLYISASDYKQLSPKGETQNLLIYLKEEKNFTYEEQVLLTAKLEKAFEQAGMKVAENWNTRLIKQAFVEHLKVMITFLSIVSMLAISVGGISMTALIGINVSERRRELGVLRAIGGGNHKISMMILLEVLLMGLTSWGISIAIAYPISIITGNYFGQIFLHRSLVSTISLSGTMIWLIIAFLTTLIAGFIPTKGAIKASLREMLVYE